jgi:hypothetical protein
MKKERMGSLAAQVEIIVPQLGKWPKMTVEINSIFFWDR